MNIEHIAMYVDNLEKTRDFLLNILMHHLIVVIIIRLQISVHIF